MDPFLIELRIGATTRGLSKMKVIVHKVGNATGERRKSEYLSHAGLVFVLKFLLCFERHHLIGEPHARFSAYNPERERTTPRTKTGVSNSHHTHCGITQ